MSQLYCLSGTPIILDGEQSEWKWSVCNAAAPSAKHIPDSAIGKLVGAVTYMLVTDTARGYGIFIEEEENQKIAEAFF